MLKKIFITSFALVSVTMGTLYATETGSEAGGGGEVGNGGQNQKSRITRRIGGEVGNGHLMVVTRPPQSSTTK